MLCNERLRALLVPWPSTNNGDVLNGRGELVSICFGILKRRCRNGLLDGGRCDTSEQDEPNDLWHGSKSGSWPVRTLFTYQALIIILASRDEVKRRFHPII